MPSSLDTEFRFSGKSLIGKQFGRLRVIGYAGYQHRKPNGGRAFWLCRCECGNESLVEGGELAVGGTVSCGCYRLQRTSESHTTHGLNSHPLYQKWASMIFRCTNRNNPGWMNYGGRGISVCREWRDFSVFFNDMAERWSPGLELDRIDNNGDYCPQNCRWATKTEQCNNRRSNRLLTWNGETKTLAQWAHGAGIRVSTFWSRIKSGWSVERAISTPIRPWGR